MCSIVLRTGGPFEPSAARTPSRPSPPSWFSSESEEPHRGKTPPTLDPDRQTVASLQLVLFEYFRYSNFVVCVCDFNKILIFKLYIYMLFFVIFISVLCHFSFRNIILAFSLYISGIRFTLEVDRFIGFPDISVPIVDWSSF